MASSRKRSTPTSRTPAKPARKSSRRGSLTSVASASTGPARKGLRPVKSGPIGPARKSPIPILKGSHIYSFLSCPHLLYLDEFGDRRLRDEESSFEENLREEGKRHEEAALKALGLDISEVRRENFEDGVRETLRLMKSGEKWIYQGCLAARGMRGSPDLLRRVKGESPLGSHYYMPLELKSGSAYENEENGRLKRRYALQLAFYAHLLGRVQGVRPGVGKVIGDDFRTVDFSLDDWKADYEETLAEIRAILGHKTKSEPEISSGCGHCHWRSCCLDWARKADDVTLIRKLNGGTRHALRAAGIRTIAELAALEAGKELPDVDGITHWRLRHLVRRAGVVKRGKPLLKAPVSFPKAAVELFFDIETDLQEDICYLYGVVERRGKKQRYVSFFAESPADERKIWTQFWKYLSGIDDFHMYHYSDYEKKQLSKLAERHRCNRKLFERFFGHGTDLYHVVDKHTEWPSHSYSIKAISGILGFHYSDPEPGGLKAAQWYTTYAGDPAGNAELKKKLLQYNKEDCLAMIVLKDWMVEESKRISRQGELAL